MKEQLNQEKRAMNKHWSMRDKQIDRVAFTTTGMYGQLQAILGSDLPEIEQLEFPGQSDPDLSTDDSDL